MFTRQRRLGHHLYTEALESYRDGATGRPRHRCVARWRAERSLAEEIGRTQFDVEEAARMTAYYQGVIDRTVRANFPRHHREAPRGVKQWQRRLDIARTHLAALMEARQGGVAADDVEIERAAQAEADRWGALAGRMNALLQPRGGGGD